MIGTRKAARSAPRCGPWRACTLVAAVAFLGGADAPSGRPSDSVFEPPVRLEADGAAIDSGPQWAHSGPCLHDVDGDGRRDLVVGDFSGLFRLYRNVGTDAKPRFTAAGKLQAAGQDAKVPVY
jgi:hypothetical protein